MANGAGSGALPSKTVSSHVFQPTTLTACKLFSISKMHRILSSPPISASQVARQAAIPRSSTRFATCGLEFREPTQNTVGPTFQGGGKALPTCWINRRSTSVESQFIGLVGDPYGILPVWGQVCPGCFGVLPLGGAVRLKRRHNHVNAKNSGSRCSPYHTRWFQPRDDHRFLPGSAGYAIGHGAAQSRCPRRDPPLLRHR